jgi:hypothetical protein
MNRTEALYKGLDPEDGGSRFLRNIGNYQITRRHASEAVISIATAIRT